MTSLLKRWSVATRQGAASREHFDYYLDEFTFPFNRRTAGSRGKPLCRLVEQAAQIEPAVYKKLIRYPRSRKTPDHKKWGYPSQVDTPQKKFHLDTNCIFIILPSPKVKPHILCEGLPI